MCLRFSWQRLLAAAIVLIAMAVAPSMANAHTQHRHGPPVAQSVTVAPPGIAVTEMRGAPALAIDVAQDILCISAGCCSGTVCSTCCAISPELPVAAWPALGHVRPLHGTRLRTAFSPDGLQRPPKTFA